MVALSSLAFGSGAVLSSAAFADSVEPTADMRVAVAPELEVRAGQAFDDDGSVREEFEDDFVEFESNDSFFEGDGLEDIERDDLPVATVNRRDENINDGVELQVAVPLILEGDEEDKHTFEDILEIENRGDTTAEVGISYDREEDQYGEDVNVDGNPIDEISPQTVQLIYQFVGKGEGISGTADLSPDPNEDDDDPEEFANIDPGEVININAHPDTL